MPADIPDRVLVRRRKAILALYSHDVADLHNALYSNGGAITDIASAAILGGTELNDPQFWPLVLLFPNQRSGPFIDRMQARHGYYINMDNSRDHRPTDGPLVRVCSMTSRIKDVDITVLESPSTATRDAMDIFDLTAQQTLVAESEYQIRWPRLFSEYKSWQFLPPVEWARPVEAAMLLEASHELAGRWRSVGWDVDSELRSHTGTEYECLIKDFVTTLE